MSSYFDGLRGTLTEQLSQATDYAVTKSDEEKRYTLGVLYVPSALDADDEYATADELQEACWEYIKKGYRGIRDTHTNVEIGELVELISWPHEVITEARTGDGTVKKYKLPAGTVFAGVQWQPDAWALVKTGRLRGYSLGGRAIRMKEASNDGTTLPYMREMLHVEDLEAATKTVEDEVEKDREIPNKPGKTNWVEQAGGLPPYIRKIAKDLLDDHDTSGAIRLAVGIVKRWCRGQGGVTAKTKAKACKAVAQWEKMKAKSHATKKADEDLTDEEYFIALGSLDEDTLDEIFGMTKSEEECESCGHHR